MASIDKVGGKYRVRWRETSGGPQSSKVFTLERDAKRFRTQVEHDLDRGTYVSPSAARTTVAEYVADWLDRMRPTWRPSTSRLVENSLRHVLPTFGGRPLVSIRKSDVERWAASLTLAPQTVATVRQHFGQMFASAVEDGLIARNPCTGARLPKVEHTRVRPIPPEVVDRIAAELVDWLTPALWLGVGAGLRLSEASGLMVGNVDFLRRRIVVAGQLVSPERGAPYLGPAKTPRSHRTIPVDNVVLERIARHLDGSGKGRDDLVITNRRGQPVRRQRFGDAWREAVRRAGCPDVTFHDCRHTFASLLLSDGVNVRAVADWMGHASPTITLATYSHLMPVDDDRGRAVIRAAFARPQTSLPDTAKSPGVR